MTTIKFLLPDPEILLSFEPEELAGYLLEYFNGLPERLQNDLNRYNFSLHCADEYSIDLIHQEKIKRAFMEAWAWLEREGFLAPRPGEKSDWVFITRRGKRILGHTDLQVSQRTNLLPKKLLHPIPATKVWPTFIRGDWDTAVFQAFKEVEVAVRKAGGFTNEDIGTELMRKAFNEENGPLTDKNAIKSEKQAVAHLFAGAIGLYKNPTSHRHAIETPEEATEMILLASHLLRIVDTRS